MNILTQLLDWCFQPREQALLLRHSAPSDQVRLYTKSHHRDYTYLASYNEPLVKAAIIEHKFFANPQAHALLESLFSRYCTEATSSQQIFVPIPLSKARQRKRGFNQVERILQRVVRRQQIRTDLLTRSVDKPPQTSLARTARLQNVAGVFDCSAANCKDLDGQTVILLDDVITTGATMAAARATLAPHLPPNTTLICLALAH